MFSSNGLLSNRLILTHTHTHTHMYIHFINKLWIIIRGDTLNDYRYRFDSTRRYNTFIKWTGSLRDGSFVSILWVFSFTIFFFFFFLFVSFFSSSFIVVLDSGSYSDEIVDPFILSPSLSIINLAKKPVFSSSKNLVSISSPKINSQIDWQKYQTRVKKICIYILYRKMSLCLSLSSKNFDFSFFISLSLSFCRVCTAKRLIQ